VNLNRSKSVELLRPRSQSSVNQGAIGKGRADLREYEYKVPVNANAL